MKHSTHEQAPDFWGYARNYLHHFLPQVRELAPNSIDAYRISLESYVHYLVLTVSLFDDGAVMGLDDVAGVGTPRRVGPGGAFVVMVAA